jgi:hypothetical protein
MAILLRHCSSADCAASIIRGLADQLDRWVVSRGQPEVTDAGRGGRHIDVRRRTSSVLMKGNVSRLVVLMLDGLDELRNARELVDWLPVKLANNIKV